MISWLNARFPNIPVCPGSLKRGFRELAIVRAMVRCSGSAIPSMSRVQSRSLPLVHSLRASEPNATMLRSSESSGGPEVRIDLISSALSSEDLAALLMVDHSHCSFDDLDGPPVVVGAMTYIDLITPDVLGPSAFHGLTVSPVTACTCRRSGGRRAM